MTTTAPDIEAYRHTARQWLADNLERRASGHPSRQRGGGHRSPEDFAPERALQTKLYEAGYAGITWPTAYGGQGLDPEHARAFSEEAAGYVLPDLGIAGGVTFGVCGPTMLQHASPEFLAHHVPLMLSGRELWCQFFSEPGAGSDLAGITTRAVRDGDRWILTGSKIWSSGAYYADYGMCLARTDWEVPKHRGLSWFAVPTAAPGVTVQPIREINGDAEFCQEFLDEVELSDDAVIGEVNQGWSVAQTMLVYERGAGREPGDNPYGVEETGGMVPDLVALARRVGRLEDPVARQLLAQAHINDYVRNQLMIRVAGLIRAGTGPASGIASYGKLAAGTFDPVRARIALEIGGGSPLSWAEDDPRGARVAIDYLNSRIMAIAGGTNEMQRNGISERVLGLPREPSFDSDKPFNEVVRSARSWSGKV